jgi:hypothetical protein
VRTIPSLSAISLEEARRLACRHLLLLPLSDVPVEDGVTVIWRRHMVRGQEFDPSNAWIVFLPFDRPLFVLCSSEVVVVCKHTGRILYHGSLNDEG